MNRAVDAGDAAQTVAPNAASTKQTEREAQNLHELGPMLELLVEEHQGEHTRPP